MADSRYSRYYVYIKPVISNKYVRSFAPYIFSLISLIIFIIFAIRPTVITIIELQKSIQDNQKVLDQLDQKVKDLADGKKNLDNIDPELKRKINSQLPTNPLITDLISNLQTSAVNVASVSALQVQPITLYNIAKSPQKEIALEEITFSFNIQGTYPQLTTVLNNFPRSSRLFNLTSVILNKTSDGETTLSISGKGYYLK